MKDQVRNVAKLVDLLAQFSQVLLGPPNIVHLILLLLLEHLHVAFDLQNLLPPLLQGPHERLVLLVGPM